ncbi:MAG: protein kinase, partial [Myxococcota bacterium]
MGHDPKEPHTLATQNLNNNLSQGIDELDTFELQLKNAMRDEPTKPFLATVGATIGGSYLLLKQLGQGGMGQVFLAKHLRTHGQLALKLIKGHLLSSPRALKRFEMEARLTASIRHPHVVMVTDYGEDRGQVYMAMEHCPGPDLRSLVMREGPLPWPRAVALIGQVLRALNAAHTSPRCLIHRDIKPANILVLNPSSDQPFVKVVDFGISIAARGGQAHSSEILGSPHTMSPEQFRGEVVSPATDLYAVGCTLFIMLTGASPFQGTLEELKQQHMFRSPPVDSLEALVPDALVHWLDRMMAKRVNRRPRTALEALETLEQLHEAALTGGVAPAPRGVESWEDTTEQHTRPAEGHLPRPSTSFVGRHHPLEQLDHLVVELQERCVTLHGMGGLGKSRLAVEWARSQRHQWPGGAWFCALAQVRSEEGILIALAQLLGVQLSQEPMEQLCDVLRDLGQALLILDNVEQLTAPMSAVLSRWLEAAPELTVLLTSRRPLGLEGEQVLALQPLELPPTALSVKRVEGESMELFWDRAKAVCPDWEQTPELMADIARLVRQLDGLPLAIELAAARCRVMSPG